jgi:3-oxoacyl-[acyl-carrier-protein] synthase-3
MTGLPAITIIGVGHHVPPHVQDNATLCRHLPVTPEWIVEKTGITGRALAAPEDTASDFARRAAEQALAVAGIAADQVDLIVGCTFSADYLFPSLAAKLHHDLRAAGAQTFDLQANCAGFVAGLTAASDRMRVDPSVRHALVVGVEMNSRYVDPHDPTTAIYVGDGAGAAVLGRGAAGEGIAASAFFTDSANYESVRLRFGGSSFRRPEPRPPTAVEFMEINGLATWKQAITHLPRVIRDACRKSSVDPASVDLFVFHQANYRLIEYIVRKMGYGMERTHTNVQAIGNTGAASVAIALSDAYRQGKLGPGDTLVLAAVGAGFTFGASVWRWTLPRPEGAA